MKKICFFFLIFGLVFSVVLGEARENKEEEIPPGMEVIEVGKAKIVVPKGLKIKKGAASIILEEANEYVARKVWEMEQRLAEFQIQTQQLRKEVERLKKELEDIKKSQLVPEEAENE